MRKLRNLVRQSPLALRKASSRFLKVSKFAAPCCLCLSIILGPSGRVKLAPKVPKSGDDAKEVS